MNTHGCDHLKVRITRILKAYSEKTGTRTIGGNCEVCGKTVRRVVTSKELSTGKIETQWV